MPVPGLDYNVNKRVIAEITLLNMYFKFGESIEIWAKLSYNLDGLILDCFLFTQCQLS